MSESYFKAIRSEEATELLLANHNAFILLYVIASRARRTSAFNRYNLQPGEALIGDYAACGLTEQKYRTAKIILEKGEFATFRTTNRGTIATLMNSMVFDINQEDANGQTNEQPTDKQRTANGQTTTNKNVKKEKNVKNESEVLEIWQAYPLKKSKPDGLKAISRALQKKPFEELLSLTKRFADARNGDMAFCPNPSTWFNQERYNDDPATWGNTSATAQKPIVHTNGNF